MGKTVAIVQSNYIPWKGYFDLMRRSDEFILYDDAQYTRRDWRNRNLIKTAQGLQWLTIPVQTRGQFEQRICDVEVSDPAWGRQHCETLRRNYAKAPFFDSYRERLEPLYRDESLRSLSQINQRFLVAICEMLGIQTRIAWSSDYQLVEGRTERLVDLCRQAGAKRYLSGPSARAYLDESLFAAAGIEVVYMDYTGYPEYPQSHPPFEHRVTVLDLLFHTGPEAPRYLQD